MLQTFPACKFSMHAINGKTNADQWLWSMELALRSCLLFGIVSGAISKELLPEETWLHDAEPDRMTQVEDPENFTSPSPPAEPVPKSGSYMTTRMIAEEPAAAATAQFSRMRLMKRLPQ